MLVALLVFMIAVEIYLVFTKHNLLHPIVYFFGIWTICILFTVIDFYDSLIEITMLTKRILILGIISFFIGAILPKLRLRNNSYNICYTTRTNNTFKKLHYNKTFIIILLFISLTFNSFMTIITISLLTNNVPYSTIRDIYLSYGDNSSFFTSTFFSTFNSWISAPCTYAISILLAIDIFKRKLGRIVLSLMAIDIALFTFATSGRLLVLIFAIHIFFCFNYYKVKIPKKLKKKVGKWFLYLVVALFIMTIYRSKDIADSKDHVYSIYAYFAISIPLLSKWVSNVQSSGIIGGCTCTLNGVFEILHYLYSKLFGPMENYISIMEILSLPQNKWVNIYHDYWANAFCTMFYYFYLDLREFGVVLYSFIFGFLSRRIYYRTCVYHDERFLPLYLVIIQTIFCGFIRWQWGTFTYLVLIGIVLFPFWGKIKTK